MTGIRDDFLATARSAAGLLREPAVAAAWDAPSALPEFRVSGLAGHLAYQVLALPPILAGPEARERTISLLDHYDRAKWNGAPVDDEFNVRIRDGGEEVAAQGPAALTARVDAVVKELAGTLPGVAPDRPVRLPL
ncbi:maleylpyruvate isomerase N-terminal domain-containing protein [Sphaerisporangium album]|uniref:maleylpyruvate isomerase N-terminal domain-containing protein n=1 Tax=Sphaerisporangium album TaxID=509200 RepID=UPI001C68B396|nr:maleylpyruvate isomerase N-terminal domain-containing protein [Sphaerisporangium album]